MLQNDRKISHQGVISAVFDDSVEVSVRQISACAACHAKGACSMADKKEKTVKVSGVSGQFGKGETVWLECSASMGLSAIFYAFVIPLFLTVAALFGIRQITASDTWAVAGSLGLLALYFALLYLCKSKFEKKFGFKVEKANS